MASFIVTSLMVTAAPSPLDDEEFLLFLADSLENEDETVDALSMIEDAPENTLENTKNQNEINPQQEDKNEH